MLTKKTSDDNALSFLIFSVSKPLFFPSSASFFRFRGAPIFAAPALSPRTRAMTSSADRINLAELTSQLANAEARVCEWASAAGKRADAARLEHGRRIAALRGEIGFLTTTGFTGALAGSSLLLGDRL